VPNVTWSVQAATTPEGPTIWLGEARTALGPKVAKMIAERYSPSRIADAVTHVSQAGRAGVVLIDF
jgi:hypothetical protein